ncbi:hypothetical protein PISMIDRAFT_10952 [Pisolithus microcarpus 441]|uniref:Unplaced genomic scaffold scaffold_43, whole genome shotgun sequence n=1 Tax=Pisolithus microcarpus 441 TaxID=765257 RepID=A0A0C9ZUF3_9AGAM|nr:hypothetical protein PISMIDRAFT_10952 [Pisolithus microcarpus 441]
MSMTKTATSTKAATQPRYLSPDASRELIPKMWAANMEKLRSLMREVPDEAAAEDVVRGWMDKYYEVSDHIEGLRQYAADLSTEVPDYPKETQEAIGSSFLELVPLRKHFPRRATKSKPKPVPGGASGSQAGGETTRWSQWQLEKAAARGNEGDKDLPASGGSAPIKAAATSPQESATWGSGGGTEVPTLGMQVETEACKQCVKRGVKCVWKDRAACVACHIGKKRCGKAGKPGRKQKNPDAPPASLALTSKRARMMSVPPPSSSAPPKGALKVHPRVISQAIPAAGAVASLPNLNLPPTTPSISQPPPPLFLPSSPMNMPVPSTSWTEVEPLNDPMTFATSLSGLLDEAPSGELEANRSGDEGNPKTHRLSVQGEDDIGSHPCGLAEAWWTLFGGTPHAVAQYNTHLAAAISTVEWAESLMAELHSGMGQLGLIIQRAKRDIRQLQEWR